MRYRALPLVLSLLVSVTAYTQTGDGSLRGYVRDESGAVLPGVSVTAQSDVLMSPVTVLTDGTGYYRIPYLPNGPYTLTFELTGFATTVREGIDLRAGANFAVDAFMKISGIQETINVTAETPMLEIAKPNNVLNVEGDYLREMPVQARRNWSDFLELTPGVHARPVDDSSGRMVYLGHATDVWAHVILLEGMPATSYQDTMSTLVAMSTDVIDDVQVKTGGVDAASPLGTGLVINIVSKRGGNEFRGSVGYDYQPYAWNDDNSPEAGNYAGTPTTQRISQFDASLGGPIVRDKVWFFTAFRYSDLGNGISYSPRQTEIHETLSGIPLGGGRGTVPEFEPLENITESFQPYVKVTAQLTTNHEASFYYQRDKLDFGSNYDGYYEAIYFLTTGGDLFGGKLTSIWGATTTSQLTVSYNNKGRDTNFDLIQGSGPMISIHEGFVESGGELSGTGQLSAGNNTNGGFLAPSSMLVIKGDITHYKEGWGGSHELQGGVYLAPRNRKDRYFIYSNFDGDGWFEEKHRLIDPANPSLGTVPFERVRRDVGRIQDISARDSDIGVYFQDSWKPHPRLTLNLGARVDFVKRHDALFDFDRMDTVVFGPRIGFSYMVTADARNVLRGSAGRIHEAVVSRDGASLYTGTAGDSGGRSTLIVQQDREGDGVWEDTFIYPPADISLDPSVEFDPDLTQPFVDEYIIGFRKQFRGQTAVDTALIHRRYKKTYALLEINGIYPDEPYQPFVGFGRIDPNRGTLYQQTNNSWSELVYTALELTFTKRLARRFQATAGINYQWQHMAGDWNPGDPARFIQPDHFPNNKALYMPRGNDEQNSLRNSNNLSYAPTWRRYSIRLGANYLAPAGINLSATYTQNAGPWTGPLIDRLSRNDPEVTQYGPPRIPLENGLTAANPLATVYRFVGEDRGDGQVQAPTIRALGLKIGKVFRLPQEREFQISGTIFNVFNWGDHHQYTYSSANRVFSPNFLQLRNLQLARAFQLTFIFRF